MDAGVKPLMGLSLEAALVKLMVRPTVDVNQSIYFEVLS